MTKKLNHVLIVDDCLADNYLHAINIHAETPVENLVIRESGNEALDYLLATQSTDAYPDLILLDIRMPGMDGWEFLTEYKKLDQHDSDKAKVALLTHSLDFIDKDKALLHEDIILDCLTKPLTRESYGSLVDTHFD